MNIHEFKDNIIEYINYSHEDNNLELEAILKPTYSEPINLDDFTRLMSRLKPLSLKQKQIEVLDIIYEYQPGKQSNIRVSILGKQNIKKYCETNKLTEIDERYVKFLRKQRVKVEQEDTNGNTETVILKPIDIDNYNIRINLKSEEYVSRNHQNVLDILDRTWTNKRKFFRYKNRFSFEMPNKNFIFDLTIVKSSPIKILESESRKNIKFVYTKNIQDSKVFNNDSKYEIELEYIGNKKKLLSEPLDVLKEMFNYVGFMLQSHQKSYFICSKDDRKIFREQYTKLLGLTKYRGFQGPNSITIERKHIDKRSYIDYKDSIINIRRNYSVTDKADGERNCLVTLEDGRMFMINRKHYIRYLGGSCNYPNTIIDGEYIEKDKDGKNISLFMAFDIYILEANDVRDKIFQRAATDFASGSEKSRYELLEDVERNFELTLLPGNKLKFLAKKFYFGDSSKFDEYTLQQISDLELQILDEEKLETKDEDKIKRLNQQLDILYSDSLIFDKAKMVYEKEYIYKIDGLIFTPINLAVGEDIITKKTNFNGRWFYNFKWKPPEENTIDFLIYFEKEDDNPKKDKVSFVNINQKVESYKTAILNVGYDPDIHTKYNACRVLNENLVFKSGYYPTKFYPTNPYSNKVTKCKILLKDGVPVCENGNIITDGKIVEFRYNGLDNEQIWIPLRTRDILTPNDYLTASNVWTSINNPVSTDMIIGEDDSIKKISLLPKNDVYYSNTKKRDSMISKPMNDLHSLIKKELLTKNTEPNTNLLDVSAGKLGDLNHWIDSNLSSVVAVDISKDNIDNVNNGSCIRLINQMNKTSSNPLLNNILLVWGDSSKNLINGDAGFDELNKYYLNIVYGRIGKQNINSKKLKLFHNMGKLGFDAVSCQFSFHYFCKDEETLNSFFENVSFSLKQGGKFLITCLDGNEVFSRLETNPILEGQYEGNVIWKITKKYSSERMKDNEECLGMEIDVYLESINQTITEYLVNNRYIIKKAREFNLEIVETTNFKDLYDTIVASGKSYGDISKINDVSKEYSFMNNIIVFKKI